MRDSRQRELAELLINHSTRIQPGEHVLIEMFDAPYEMAIELVEATRRAGGHPHIELRSQPVMRALQWDADEDHLKVWADCDLYRMKKMAAYIGLRGASNVSEECDVPDEEPQSDGRDLSHASSSRTACKKDKMVRSALANFEHGSTGKHEYRSI